MKVKKWLSCILASVMLFAMAVNVAGCGGENPDNTGDSVTVTWFDGRTELRHEEVKKGSKVQEWTPSKDGFEFFGWYADAAFGSEFKFDEPIEEDTDIFARFRSATPDEDNRMWYVIGSVPGENWDFLTELNDEGEWVKSARGQVESNQKYFFKNEGNNVFSVTLTLRPNCKFQFVTNLIDTVNWDGDEGKGRMGLGNLKGFEYASGNNPEADGGHDGYHDIEDRMYGEVRDAEGNVVFNGGQGYDVATYCWNIYPAEGSDGVYEFRFKSYPGDEAVNVVEWKCIEKLEPLESLYDMYLTGSYYNSEDDVNPSTQTGPADVWDDDYTADWCIHFTKEEGTTLHKAFITVTEDMYPTWSQNENPSGQKAIGVKVKNYVDGKDYGCGGENGTPGTVNVWLTAGTWCITFDEVTGAVSWELCDYYVVGTFLLGETNHSFCVSSDKITPKMTTSDGGDTYTASVNVPDVSNAAGYEWLKEKKNEDGTSAVFAVKAALGCKLGIMEFYGTSAQEEGQENDTNFYFYATGTYKVTYTVETGTVTAEKTSDEFHELKTVKVYYYDVTDGTNRKINEEELMEGDTVTYRPQGKLKYKFDGWYLNPACTSKFGGTVGNESMLLYGKFVEGYDLDPYDYYIAGTGLTGGTLGSFGSFEKLSENLKMKKAAEPDEDGFTVYTIDMTIYASDTFKVVRNLSWSSGTFFGYSQMRDSESRFSGSGVGNIICKTGNDGKYTITFHSNPYNFSESYIEYEFKESVTAQDPYKMYLAGNLEATGWNKFNANQNYCLPMTRGEDGVTWSVTVHFTGGDSFKVWNAKSNTWFPDGTDDNIYIGARPNGKDPVTEKETFIDDDGKVYQAGEVLPGTGWYTITWSQDNPDVILTPLEGDHKSEEANKQVMYLIGNFEANGNDSNWATNKTDKMLAMTRDDSGYTWSVTAHFKSGDQFKVYRFFTATKGEWVPDDQEGSEKTITEDGTYTVTWNHFTNEITFVKTADVAVTSVAAQVLKLLSNTPLCYSRRYCG